MEITQDYKDLHLNCQICKENSHLINKCPLIQHSPDPTLIIEKKLFSLPTEKRTKIDRAEIHRATVFFKKKQEKAVLSKVQRKLIEEEENLLINYLKDEEDSDYES